MNIKFAKNFRKHEIEICTKFPRNSRKNNRIKQSILYIQQSAVFSKHRNNFQVEKILNMSTNFPLLAHYFFEDFKLQSK